MNNNTSTPSPAELPELPNYARFWSCDASAVFNFKNQDNAESFRAALNQAASRHMTGRRRIHMIWIKKCPTGPDRDITLFNYHPLPAFTDEAFALFPDLCHEFRRITEYKHDKYDKME